MFKLRFGAAVDFLLVIALYCQFGQFGLTQITTGTISGTVQDTTGAALPAARAVLKNEDTGITRTVTTDSAGRYSAPLLSLGRYTVTASLEGFQSGVRTGIVLTVGREAVVDFQLSVGSVTQTLEVIGEAPLVETKESTVSFLVNDATIRDLPLNGRDITNLILLNPGVNYAISGKTGAAFMGFGKRLGISGLTGEDNAYLLDGAYINDYNRHIPAGPSHALLGTETVQEFQVITSSPSAQYGRAQGGTFNAVSKSGTNEWHGGVYEFVRHSAMDARNYFDVKADPSAPRLPPFHRNQFGATASGPIARNKAFFFLGYEGVREVLTNSQVAPVPDLNARKGLLPNANNPAQLIDIGVSPKIAPFLSLYALPSPTGRNFGGGVSEFLSQVERPAFEDFGQARVDYQFSDSDSLFARFTGSNGGITDPENIPSYFTDRSLVARLFTVSQTHIFSPRMLNILHAHFSRIVPGDIGGYPEATGPEQISVPGSKHPPAIRTTGLARLRGATTPVDFFASNRFNFQDDVNFTVGGHSLQYGGMIERLRFNEGGTLSNPFGNWSFSSLQSFLQGIPSSYTGTPPQLGTPDRGFRQWFMALYLQDSWQINNQWALNLGLRWEPYSVPTEVNGRIINLRNVADPAPTVGESYWVNKSWKNFGPRVGFAWKPFQSDTVAVRGGAAVLFVPLDPAVYASPGSSMAPLAPTFTIANPSPALFPNALAVIASGSASGFGDATAIPYETAKSPRAIHYNLNLQQQVGQAAVFTLGYIGSRGINQYSSGGNFNMPLATFNGTSLEFPVGRTVLNPAFGLINYSTGNVDSWYNGLTATMQHRAGAGLQMMVTYTFSKTLSDGSDRSANSSDSSSVKYPYDMRATKGLSAYDLRHVLSVNYSYDLPFKGGNWRSGWQLTGIISARSGQPFNISAAVPSTLSPLGVGIRSPNLVPGFTKDQIIQGGADQYFNPMAYSLPGSRELGNVGRDTLTGPGLVQWDMGLTKNIAPSERWHVQFRAELFNILNHANFSPPGELQGAGSSANSGQIFAGNGSRLGTAGLIDHTVTTSRQIQLGVKLIF